MTTTQTAAGSDFVISRVLDAPRDLVWKCFTDPEHMKQWWGPKGVKVVKSEMDLRPGGTYLYGMQTPDGAVMWGRHGLSRDHAAGKARVHQLVLRRERRPHAAIRWRRPGRSKCCRSSPSKSSRAARPSSPSAGRRTTRRDEERKTFDAGHASMTQGWSGTMEQLEAYLAKAKA